METKTIKKVKTKRSKRCEYDNQNISMRSSFNKFDELEKQNLLHLLPNDDKKLEVHKNSTIEKNAMCRQCNKAVYKMEEIILRIKTETVIFHKTCFRCRDCLKQLRPENSHFYHGCLYCNIHFKLIFAPKIIYEEEHAPRKPELIIRENEPKELPSEVARASDKPNLGLEELQNINVRSKFKVFEYDSKTKNEISEECQDLDFLHNNIGSDDENDVEFIRSVKLVKRETPVGLGDAINDIRSRFEQGKVLSKEERREETKQEIQNIRSRLFMGKQAKIKEMYQLAVAESKQGMTSVGKIPNDEVMVETRSIKTRFENGELFKKISQQSKDESLIADADVFESGLGRASRSIFMKLDANQASNIIKSQVQTKPEKTIMNSANVGPKNHDIDVIKYDYKPDDVQITTEILTERFNFFEKFRNNEKRQYGVAPSGLDEQKISPSYADRENLEQKQLEDTILGNTQTTSTINKFREIFEKKNNPSMEEIKPKPLKCFTPPPENLSFYNSKYSDEDNNSDDDTGISEDEENNLENDSEKSPYMDQALQDARNAARAKQLRAKFEKWQIREMENELNEDRVDVYSQLISNESIESAKTIRERFENMNNLESHAENVPRHPIKRFV
ncbi:uncharacterized protein LOC6506040 [Drosophila ananassae]|nr:uncharacterized protein LOC6506040 [Drosophila ananassae]XP_044573705.1 uncharacterized protein LOC6506040 [Drosophila ananassae]